MTRVASALDAATVLTMPTCCALGDSPHPGRHGQGAIHPGRLPAPEEGPTGCAQGHHRHGPQAGPHDLRHAALWPGLRGCRCGVLRTPVSATGVARRQTSGGTIGLPLGANVGCRGQHHVRTFRRVSLHVMALVSGEQSYARVRAVQRRLTGESAQGCMLMTRRAVRIKTERTLVLIARWGAWSGRLATASLVTLQAERSRSIDCSISMSPSGGTSTLQARRE